MWVKKYKYVFVKEDFNLVREFYFLVYILLKYIFNFYIVKILLIFINRKI